MLWFLLFPWKTNPKQDLQCFSHLNTDSEELFLTSCFCLHFLPRCYFITPTTLDMKCLRDGGEVTEQTNGLHIQPHPACSRAVRLREGFKSTERVTSCYPHTLVFPFCDWGRITCIYTGSPVLWYTVLQVWTEQELVNFQDHPKRGIYEINKPSRHREKKILLIFSTSNLIILKLITNGNRPCLIMDKNINNILPVLKLV